MMAAASDRPEIADMSKATADELRAVWNPMIANSGVYELQGDLLTIRPIAAKFPVVMKPGAFEIYSFRVQDKTLWLTQKQNARGQAVQGAAPTKLTRVE
jgi:hypothetical protein